MTHPTQEDDVKAIRDALAAKPTPGPYQVVVTEHPHHRGNCHIERRIFTAWDHPQMKGPIGIVNGAVGIGATEGGPVQRFTAIEAADAEWFAACYPERIARLIAHIDAQAMRLDAAERDAARYRWLRDRFIGADFDWNESGQSALLFRLDQGSKVWGDSDMTIDAAIASEAKP